MRISRLLLITGTLALLSVTLWAVTASRSYVAPKIAAGEVKISKVCMVPAAAQLKRVGVKGQEGMAKESDNWSLQLQNIVENHLKQAGAEITPSNMSSDELQENPDLQAALLNVQQRYDTVAQQLDKKSQDVKKGRYTLGDEVTLLPCSAKSDALVFVHGQGNVLTSGKKAFGTLIGGASRSTAYLRVSFVDAKTGDVLAYSYFLNTGDFETDSEKAYGKKLKKEFEKMGIGTFTAKKK